MMSKRHAALTAICMMLVMPSAVMCVSRLRVVPRHQDPWERSAERRHDILEQRTQQDQRKTGGMQQRARGRTRRKEKSGEERRTDGGREREPGREEWQKEATHDGERRSESEESGSGEKRHHATRQNVAALRKKRKYFGSLSMRKVTAAVTHARWEHATIDATARRRREGADATEGTERGAVTWRRNRQREGIGDGTRHTDPGPTPQGMSRQKENKKENTKRGERAQISST
jgi:hypothetical protein